MLLMLPAAIYATVGNDGKDDKKKKAKMEKMMDEMPDSLYEDVKVEDLLKDEVYIKLACDGWSSREIQSIMGNYIKENRKNVRGSFEYGMYAKQWLPTFGITPGNDSIYAYVEPELNKEAVANVRKMLERTGSDYYPTTSYTPDDRKQKIRHKGLFRQVEQNPYTGRIHWIVVNPEDKDALMVVPDGAGIFRTSDMGKTWDCVTDRIPDREFRKICSHSAIPVDPDNWDHFFAFMKSGGSTAVYETTDGGLSWQRVENATHKNFKRGYAFRDKEGNLKFIGAVQSGNYMNNELWISENKGVNWTRIYIPEELKETHPENGNKGAFLQNFAFNPLNRDKIYFTGSRSIYYFDDGAKATLVNGQKQYNVKKLRFNVLSQDGQQVRYSDVTEFPYGSTSQGFLEINPNDTLQMWFASASRNVSYGVYSAIYRSDDGGKNWITLQEPKNGIGGGLAFGNESPWGWLGGFGVNFTDTTRLYGCSMSSAKSYNGGRNFYEFGWGTRIKSEINGTYYYLTSSRHNADNHCIVSHPSGRVFRGSDSGLFMIDPEINGHEWTSIDGKMGNQLHYSIKVNEFGDQLMLGNTQDVDVQTYREGRWGHWRGYEGTEAFINPYSQTCYFSGSGGGGGLNGVSLSSWYEGYTFPDVFTGNWYLIHNPNDNSKSFFRIEDFGTQTVNLSQNVMDDSGSGVGARDIFISRAGDKAVIVVMNTNNTLVKSVDGGDTFTTVKVIVNGATVNAKYSNCQLVGDPNQSRYVYLAQNGGKNIFKIDLDEVSEPGNMTTLGLPAGIDCSDIIYHEGSGDWYFFSKNYGLYRLANGEDTWKLWMKGFNPLQAGRIAINYTTQEMVIGDYGRGIWVADLETPSDRYFKNGFALKELSNVEGRITIGIDTKWTIPQYYNYKWTVNDVEVINPYQYLSSSELKSGDRVKLELTLRESPDVTTTSAEYTVKASQPVTEYAKVPGNALYSDGNGRIDLGYVDYFFNDFTIDMWIKPESNGVILANRPVEVSKDTRGWALMIEGGKLKFRYAPANKFDLPTYETSETQEKDVVGPNVEMGKWIHVLVSQDRYGMINMYVDGNNVASDQRIKQTYPLNSSMYLSLFADGFENKCIKATVDELKIWNYAMNENDARKAMFSHNTSKPEKLAAYWSFNADNIGLEKELFSRSGIRSRVKANTEYVFMPVPVAAIRSDVKTLSGKTDFSYNGGKIMDITPSSNYSGEVGVYEYSKDITSIPDIDDNYYIVASVPYQIMTFGQADNDLTFDIDFNINPKSGKSYQLYKCELREDSKHWIKIKNLEVNESNTLTAKGINANDLNNKALIILENKPAIEVMILNNENSNEYVVYNDSKHEISIEAKTVGDMTQPSGLYEIQSTTGLMKITNNLTFISNKAKTSLVIDIDSLHGKDIAYDTIVGKTNNSIIPLPIVVKNKMLPKGIGKSATIKSGGMQVTDASVYNQLNGYNTVTMMGWVRIDDANILKGVKPMIFFRGGSSSPCGIHFADGNLRCHWNDGMYSKASHYTLTTNDIGRWVHIAMVVRPNGIDLYLDGQRAFYTFETPKAKIGSELMLGQNYSGDKWFTGAFDQVGLWNRSLTEDEVRYFMFNTPDLNDSNLVCYINMDKFDENGNVVELTRGSSLKYFGTVSSTPESSLLYVTKSQIIQNAGEGENGQEMHIALPAGKSSGFNISKFDGVSYDYISSEHPEYSPLVKEHYATINASNLNMTEAENVVITINKQQIKAGNNIKLAIRTINTTGGFSNYIDASSVTDGRAVFNVPGNLMNSPKEMMLFVDNSGNNNIEAEIFSDSFAANDTIVLDAITDVVKIKTRVISAPNDANINIVVNETAYASVDREVLNTEEFSEEEFTIRINKEGLDKLGVNPVTVKLNGVSVPAEFKFNVVLETIVNMELVNGDVSEVVVVKNSISSLPVKAKLVQGIMPDRIQITTEAGKATSSTDIGLGAAIANSDVMISENLEFHESDSPTDEGWNLIGNPYLSNVNLTKPQNVEIDESRILKYMYQYNPENDTYTVWDMVENYDPSQKLAPFQPFFVQTTQAGASLNIKPQAKSLELNRKVLYHLQEAESKIARIALFKDNSEQELDRTEIRVQRESDSEFVMGEDAIKMWGGMNGKTNEIATYINSRFMSVNVFPDAEYTVPVYLRLNSKGMFRLAVNYKAGFGEDDKIILRDEKTGTEWNLLDGDSYEFNVEDEADAAKRFVLYVKAENITDIDENSHNSVKVYTDNNNCIVENISDNSVVEIYDVAGRRIVYSKPNNHTFTVKLNEGNYIVNIRENNKDYTTKINIR